MQAPNPIFGYGSPANGGNAVDIWNSTTSSFFNDVYFAGGGNDQLSDGVGDDFVFGATGDDTFFIGSGSDILHGGVGNDVFIVNTGTTTGDVNVMHGGAGNDTFLMYETAASGINAVLFGEWGAPLTTAGINYAPQNVQPLEFSGTEVNIFEAGGGVDQAIDFSGGSTFYYANGNDTGTYIIDDRGGFDVLDLDNWDPNPIIARLNDPLGNPSNDLAIIEQNGQNAVLIEDFYNGNVIEILDLNGTLYDLPALVGVAA